MYVLELWHRANDVNKMFIDFINNICRKNNETKKLIKTLKTVNKNKEGQAHLCSVSISC